MKNQLYIFAFLLTFCFSSAQTQLQMNEDSDKSYRLADAELNKTYKALVKILNKEDKALLLSAQRNWLSFRDSHCEFESNEYKGGSIRPLIYSTCLEETTRKRTAELKSSLDSRQK